MTSVNMDMDLARAFKNVSNLNRLRISFLNKDQGNEEDACHPNFWLTISLSFWIPVYISILKD